ncbi:hypothetical protein BANRA_00008 [Escherichia coli]|nr:hypothetical protein BANRA_00008 [Escherichia coli]
MDEALAEIGFIWGAMAMTHPHDNIRVGAITFVYSVTKRGWYFRLSVIQNPLKAQRLAEEINNKREAV